MKRNTGFSCLAFIYFAHLLNLFIWLKCDVNYLTYDAHRHFLASYHIFNSIISFSPNLLDTLVYYSKVHPPFAFLVTIPFYLMKGVSQDVAVFGNSAVFLLMLMFATYRIGRLIFGLRSLACFAVFLLTMYPVIFNQMKVYLLDFPLTAVVALAIYVLIRKKRVWLFVLICLMGMLVKANFLVFLLFPVLVVLKDTLVIKYIKHAVRFKDVLNSRRLLNLIGPFILLIGLGWFFGQYYLSKNVYISNLGVGSIGIKFNNFINLILYGPHSRQTWPTIIFDNAFLRKCHALVWYVWGMINWQVSLLFFIFFMAGLIVFFRRDFPFKHVVLAWLLGGFFLTANLVYGVGFNMEVTAVRYTMPILPAVALVSVAFLTIVKQRWVRHCIMLLIGCWALVQFMVVSYPLAQNMPKVAISRWFKDRLDFFPKELIVFQPQAWMVSGGDTGSHPRDYSRYIQACQNIVQIWQTREATGKHLRILIIPDDTRLWYLKYLVMKRNIDAKIFYDWNYNHSWVLDLIEHMEEFDYVIDKQGGWQGETYRLSVVSELRRSFNTRKDEYALTQTFAFPDGGIISIYKKAGPN